MSWMDRFVMSMGRDQRSEERMEGWRRERLEEQDGLCVDYRSHLPL